MKCILYCLFLVSAAMGACPNLKLEKQAGQYFEANISVIECTSMCEGVVCVLNVTEVHGYSLDIIDCNTIGIQGEAYPGEREISFQYEFECNIFGPPVKDETVSLLLRGVEMEILLHDHDKGSPKESVEISCFSHLNDSSDISMSFHLIKGSGTVTNATCPVELNTSVGCLHPITARGWQVCRNQTAPYNCYLIVGDFVDSESGNYTCSTNVTGEELMSNELDLEALKILKPAEEPHNSKKSSSKLELGLGVGIGGFLIIMVVVFIIINAVISYRKARRNRYQHLPNEDQEDVYTPVTSSPNIGGSAVNVSVVNNTSEAEPNDSESTAANPVVSLEQPSGDGADTPPHTGSLSTNS